MYFRLFLLATGISILLSSCQSKTEQKTKASVPANNHMAVVEEVLQAREYTYLRVTENDAEKWLATSKMQAKEGDTFYYVSGLEMKDFESKDLKRTFGSIFFVNALSDKPITASGSKSMASPHGTKPMVQKAKIKISPAKNGITIAELFSHQNKYSAKTVTVKGQVVKYNAEIMGKNWLHIQDGTRDANNYDLAITTGDIAKVGDVVTCTGKISLNKDFGAGYSYDVIMEDANLVKN